MDIKRLLAKIASTGVAATALLSGQVEAGQAVEDLKGDAAPVTVTSELPTTSPLILAPSLAGNIFKDFFHPFFEIPPPFQVGVLFLELAVFVADHIF